ncbi:hypothetical protein AOXY_G1627 [Acipenser oxyrinchus oxyrinchus]|uniref:Ig-like domain-containing protein n=1 Tax=Acipenser oxyrinchus oxyrinchus TaxID=40147 RepID=A0AAD8GHD8_ACIOX|nr:hypothetical protein AOXY_G1627 [Acipenser oxyrinchus oxyrinchus]
MARCWTGIPLILIYLPASAFTVQIKNVYFIEEVKGVNLTVPKEIGGTGWVWEWTPHHGRSERVRIAQVKLGDSDHSVYSWNWTSEINCGHFEAGAQGNMFIKPVFENAGLFTFRQIKPNNKVLAKFEVYAFKFFRFLWDPVKVGTDVTRVCTISRVKESMKVQWKHNEEPSSATQFNFNTTTTFLMIQNVQEHSAGQYSCSLQINQTVLYSVHNTIRLETPAQSAHYTLYRDTANQSKLQLYCSTQTSHNTVEWSWKAQGSNSAARRIASANRNQPAEISPSTHFRRRVRPMERVSGQSLALHIAPLTFQDAGLFFCDADSREYMSVRLITLQASVEPSGGLSVGEEARLTCTVSEVYETFQLAWLKDYSRTMLISKQETLTPSGAVRSLTLVIPSIQTHHQKWACAVFQGNIPRAFLTLRLEAKERHISVGFLGLIVCIGSFLLISVAALVFLMQRKCTQAQTCLGKEQTHINTAERSHRNKTSDLDIYDNVENIYENC